MYLGFWRPIALKPGPLLGVGRKCALELSNSGLRRPQILPASTGLYPSEIEALRHAVSDRLLRDEGWTSDAEGRVLNEAGRVIFKPGYVTAIRKIIGEGDTFARQSAKQVDVGTDKLDALEPE